MAVKQIGVTTGRSKKDFIGLSTDAKPTEDVGPGSTFFETDGDQDMSIFDGTNWVKIL